MTDISKHHYRSIPLQRGRFEIPDEVTFLNCAKMSPRLRSVTAAGLESVKSKASLLEITSSDWFFSAEDPRELAARVLGADAESMAVVPSASCGIATAAASVEFERGQSNRAAQRAVPAS